ncbi:hypothetical protein [Methanosarcina sp.]|uniref:hypothetical protein n=1 Tax=Methanosarcina sp. TaxID=2213 RepID=UPI003C753B16
MLPIPGTSCPLWAFRKLERIYIILHQQEPEKAKKDLGQEEKIKKLKAKINKEQTELEELTEELKILTEGLEP